MKLADAAIPLIVFASWGASLIVPMELDAGEPIIDSPAEVDRSQAGNGSAANFVVRSYPGGPSIDDVRARCEAFRRNWHATWGKNLPQARWESPCEVVVHGERGIYQRAVGRAGATTSGSSLVRRAKTQGVVRRIDLLASTDRQLPALSHELVHVLLADLFLDGYPPLWIDEGLR